jgi:hypothetical protein
MRRHALTTIAFGGVSALALGVAAVALAAAPAPKPAAAYQQPIKLGSKGVGITFVTSATSGTVIEPGQAALGTNYPVSQAFIGCPKAKKNPGLVGLPFADVGFPGATFKLKHGKYGFSKTIHPKVYIVGSPAGQVRLKVTFTATVTNARKIAGTVKVVGGPCATKTPLKYTAKLNSKNKVAPGQ